MSVLGPSQRGHSVGDCNPEDFPCQVNPLPLAVNTTGSKLTRGHSHLAHSAPSSMCHTLCYKGGCRVSGGGSNWNAVQSGTGGTHSARCLAAQQHWIPGKHCLGRSGLAGLIYLPQEHGYTYQTPVTGGTTHLSQTLKRRGIGFCLDYWLPVLLATFQWGYSVLRIWVSLQDFFHSLNHLETTCLINLGHYKAASFDRYLSVMHTAKLTLAASTGIPLAPWGNGLTILLKKVFGNIYIDKMRAICLFRPIITGSTSLCLQNRWWTRPLGGISSQQNSL